MKESKTESQILIDQLFNEVWNQKNIDLISTLVAPHFVAHSGSKDLKGQAAFKQIVQQWTNAFPDLFYHQDEVFSTEKTVVVRWTGTGTHLGVFQGMAPTGRKIYYTGISIFKIDHNQLIEAWVNADTEAISKTLKSFSTKIYTEKDFCCDFEGPAAKIYEWLMQARPEPSCKQKLANSMREMFSTVPPNGVPSLIIPPELTEQVKMEEKFIKGVNGPVRTLVFRPLVKEKELLPVIIYMHGGGWSIEGPDEAQFLTRQLALMNQCMVISVDYRLAPEYPYPCGLDDCQSVYEWVRNHGQAELSANQNCVVLGGDSSGGNFALALALKMKALGNTPEAVVALCPGTDFMMENYESAKRNGMNGLLYDFSFYSFVRSIYAPPDKWKDPYVSPMYGDWQDICPICLISAGQDLLVDENRAFYKKLREKGHQKSEWHLYEAMPHAFYYYFGYTNEEQECYKAIQNFLNTIFKK